MITVEDTSKCSGCGACGAVCPKDCIAMTEDAYGFLFPVASPSLCIECGRCEAVCPWKKDTAVPGEYRQTAFAAYSLDKELRFSSSSGGMFGTFAQKMLEGGGIVYGAAFDETLHLSMQRVECEEELPKLFKSKYLQSDCSGAYRSIQRDLESGRTVLVCSSPCQIAAIRSFLKKEYDNLLTVDFFCHGVPSQSFFDRCKAHVEKKRGVRVVGYQFRTKLRHGATPHYYTLTFERNGKRGSETALYIHSPFYMAFQKYISLRESCYSCKFAGRDRTSDITIADFHTIDRYVDGINRFDGISMVILNSGKGNALWDSCKDNLCVYPVDLEELIRNKECFAGATPKPASRTRFLEDLATRDFEELAAIYMNPKREWKKRIYYALPSPLRNILKRLVIGES